MKGKTMTVAFAMVMTISLFFAPVLFAVDTSSELATQYSAYMENSALASKNAYLGYLRWKHGAEEAQSSQHKEAWHGYEEAMLGLEEWKHGTEEAQRWYESSKRKLKEYEARADVEGAEFRHEYEKVHGPRKWWKQWRQ